MDDDAFDDGVDKGAMILVVEKVAQSCYKFGNLFKGGRSVDNIPFHHIGHHHLVVCPETAGIFRIVQRLFCHQSMDIQQPLLCQRFIFVLYYILDRRIVVDYHLLRLVLRRFFLPQHLFGHNAGSGSTLHFAGIDGLFHQGTRQIVFLFRTLRIIVGFPETAEFHVKIMTYTLHLTCNTQVDAILIPHRNHPP